MPAQIYIVRSKYVLVNDNSFGVKELYSQDSHNISDRKFTDRQPDVYFLDEENLKCRVDKREIRGVIEVKPVTKQIEVNENDVV